MLNRMIDVAGLGMGIIGPAEIVAAFLGAEIGQPVTSSVIENPDPEIRILHRSSRR